MFRLIDVFLLLTTITGLAQTPSLKEQPAPRLADRPWGASWIAAPGSSPFDPGIFHFRRSFDLDHRPDQLIVNVSADNRYVLYVNGQRVAEGPAKGDLLHYRYETIDLAPYLMEGRNVLAAVVWNYGIRRPVAQVSYRTAFLLQVNDQNFDFLNSDQQWKVLQDSAYTLLPAEGSRLHSYLVTGPRIHLDGSAYPWGWETTGFNDQHWRQSIRVGGAHPSGRTTEFNWELVPRTIPMMELSEENQAILRRFDDKITRLRFDQKLPLTIPAHTKVKMLLDQTHLINAYPQLTVNGGKGCLIRMEYAESLIDSNGQKGNRSVIENKTISGYYDEFIPDGEGNRTFTTLWFRTWRYLEVTIQTGNSPLTIEGFKAIRRCYPFKEVAHFKAPVERLDTLWNVGWRTARLCAGETYYDCPYYEQLQYVGDTRIQALVSLYVSGDDRLMRNAIQQFADSRYADGLTMSRYPDYLGQVIPTYSLFWINMVHDYWMHRPDTAFVRQQLSTIRTILEWYEQQVDPATGLIGPTNYWNFVDWAENWPADESQLHGGVPPMAGGSSIITLQWVYALQDAAQLMGYFGLNNEKSSYDHQMNQARDAVLKSCWDPERKLLWDTPRKQSYSQHGNTWAILTDLIPEGEAIGLLDRIVSEPDLIQATFYFRFYLMQALFHTGQGSRYLAELKPWFDMLDAGLTTFAEKPDPTRSDCHAWSASPNYDLLATVAGIRPALPGYQAVSIRPSPGNLSDFDALTPHPSGLIQLKYHNHGSEEIFEVHLPEGIPGNLFYKDHTYDLKPGNQLIRIPAP